MAVSWYSPSAVLTPGGVAAGLSDLAGVISSAPERKARIEQQMAAEARADREMAMRELAEQRATQDALRRSQEFEANQRQREVELAGLTGVTTSKDPQAIARAKLAAEKVAQDKQLFDQQAQENALQRTIALDNRDATMFSNAQKGYLGSGTGAMLRPDLVSQQRKYLDKQDRDQQRQYVEDVGKGMADPNKAPMAVWPQAQMQAVNYGMTQNLERQEREAKIAKLTADAQYRAKRSEDANKLLKLPEAVKIRYNSIDRRAKDVKENVDKLQEYSIIYRGSKEEASINEKLALAQKELTDLYAEQETLLSGSMPTKTDTPAPTANPKEKPKSRVNLDNLGKIPGMP